MGLQIIATKFQIVDSLEKAKIEPTFTAVAKVILNTPKLTEKLLPILDFPFVVACLPDDSKKITYLAFNGAAMNATLSIESYSSNDLMKSLTEKYSIHDFAPELDDAGSYWKLKSNNKEIIRIFDDKTTSITDASTAKL